MSCKLFCLAETSCFTWCHVGRQPSVKGVDRIVSPKEQPTGGPRTGSLNSGIRVRSEGSACFQVGSAAGQIGGDVMLELLDRQKRLTGNQRRIVFAAILGDMLEFFDYFLIGFVLAFIVGPWELTYGQSALILLSSGIGAIIGAWFWGWLADQIGRRKVFIATVLNF